jgi:hypothetical protein
MAKTGKWLELCREASSEQDSRRMIELAQQAVELWDQEHASVKKHDGHHSESNNPPAKTLDGE